MPEDPVALTHSGGGIGSVIDFPAERGEPQELPDGGPFQHNDEVDPDEPNANAIDEQALPRIAFAEMGQDGNRTTWGYAHHWAKGATAKDGMGAWTDGQLYLHKGLLERQLGHADMMHLESPARDHLEAHAKAVGMRLPWADNFNSGAAAQSEKPNPDEMALAGLPNGKPRVDFEKGVIYDVCLMTRGGVRPAAGGGVDPDAHVADGTTLVQLCQAINADADGAKSHVTHSFLEAAPGTLKDNILRLVGRVRNARVVGDSARGDVYLYAAAAVSPTGDLRKFLLTLANEDPKAIGMSAIFRPDRTASHRDGALRIAEVRSVDFVGDAGSTNDGLLSAGPGAASQSGNVNGGKENPMDPKVEVVAASAPVAAPDADTIRQAAVAADRQYRRDLIALAKEHGIKDETWATGLYERNVPLPQARELVAAAKAMQTVPVAMVTRDGERDKVMALAQAVSRTVRIRAGNKVEEPAKEDLVACQAAEVANKWKGLSTIEMFRRWAESRGVPDAMYLSQAECADLMIGGFAGLRRRWGDVIALSAGGESTSDFPSLLMDAINKTLRQAYLDRPVTWPKFCKKNTAKDFKPLHSIAMSEFPDLLPENEMAESKDAAISDGQMQYALGIFRRAATISWKAFVNDDLSAFNRLPLEMATAARRKEEDIAYAPLTSNKLADGTDLFSSGHKNIASGSSPVTGAGGVPSVTTAGAMKQLMISQKGPAGVARLEIRPAILLVPAGLLTIAEQLIHSTWDPAASAFQRYNPYTRMSLEYNTRLDDNSAAYWYMLADLADPIVGIEIAFLESQEGPVLKQEVAFRTDDIRFAIKHCVAAAAIDYRAFVRNNGT